ncbi:hypothetical protein HDV00_000797 [Rhizophlyctis rosea]|nr:hypothetical protein HDV00_000797 [Rhizophlyctis rosea]
MDYLGNLQTNSLQVNGASISVSGGALMLNSPGVMNLNPSGALVNVTKDLYVTGNIYTGSNNLLLATQSWFYQPNERYYGSLLCTSSIDVASDARLKENIETLDEASALAAVEKIRATKFKMKTAPDEPRLGWIAQEVGETLPDLVKAFSSDGEDGYLGLCQNEMVPILWSAMKALTAKVRDVQSTLERERSSLKKLESID